MTEAPGAARLRALLGGPGYRRLFAAVRARLEAGGDAARAVSVDGLDEAERRALAGILGWTTVPAGAVRVDLDRLDRALRESSAAASLRDVMEALGGPLRDRRGERRRERDARERMWADALGACAACGREDLRRWVDALRASGTLARVARASGREPAGLLASAVEIARHLPARGELLAVFAARTAGDPHALDAGAPLGVLVLRAAAAIAGAAEVSPSSAGRRRLWREVGIDCDALSADVLVVGLRPEGGSLLARHLRECADAGVPRRVTLRELAQAPASVGPGTAVFVCENPAVVESAADVLGARCAPLVCVEGVPSTAALELLRGVAAAGAQVRVHADLDWAGLRIAGQVLAELRATPWRMGADDYRSGIRGSATGPRLTGPRAAAAWDGELVLAMAEAGRAVLEEQVLETLLAELER